MSKRKCVACGKDPAEGYASIYRDGKEQWYCHPDDGESCYVAADWKRDPSNLWCVVCDRGIEGCNHAAPTTFRIIVSGS